MPCSCCSALHHGVNPSLKKDKKLSVVLHISGTIHHMILDNGTQLQNNDISWCFLHFFKILIFQVVRRVKGQKISKMTKNIQNDKKLLVVPYVSGTIHHMIFIYGTSTCVKGYLQAFLRFFPNFNLWGQ